MKALLILFAALITANVNASEGGVTIGATRIIYNEGARQETLKIFNKNEGAQYLVQSWLTDAVDKDISRDKTFITTPPVFALKEKSAGTVRVVAINTDKLPRDRESVYYLNVKTIPAISKKKNNEEGVAGRLIITTKSVLKMFYRPKAIANPDLNSMYDKLTGFVNAGKSYFKNDSPYYITIVNLNVDGKKKDDVMFIRPFSEAKISDAVIRNVNFSIVNDFGGLTEKNIVL